MSRKKPTRSPADAAGIGPYAREREQLVALSDLRGWNVVDEETDIRSWEVRTLAGRILGHVRELFVDAKAGQVVMIDVDLAGSDRRAYLPLRLVEVVRDKRVVRADSGDLEEHDKTSGIRLSADELSQVRPGEAKQGRGPSEKVVERRPIVEETVVRRRLPDDTETRL